MDINVALAALTGGVKVELPVDALTIAITVDVAVDVDVTIGVEVGGGAMFVLFGEASQSSCHSPLSSRLQPSSALAEE